MPKHFTCVRNLTSVIVLCNPRRTSLVTTLCVHERSQLLVMLARGCTLLSLFDRKTRPYLDLIYFKTVDDHKNLYFANEPLTVKNARPVIASHIASTLICSLDVTRIQCMVTNFDFSTCLYMIQLQSDDVPRTRVQKVGLVTRELQRPVGD